MENPEELLHSLEEFAKLRPRDIPRDLEEYLCFVAKTGDPIYQWPTIKTLFREKLINVITEFYESCASMEIPACPNVEIFNYEIMKNFILEKLDTFVSAPFTVQRICELLTSPRKEYNRIDKYMRALEKNILVVSTMEPGRVGAKNGESVVNGVDSDHTPETSHCNDINVEEMDDNPTWRNGSATNDHQTESTSNTQTENQTQGEQMETDAETEVKEAEESKPAEEPETKTAAEETVFVSIQPVEETANCTEDITETDTSSSVTITPVPAGVQNRRSSVEPDVSSETTDEPTPIIEEPTETEPVATSEVAEAEAEAKPADKPQPESNEAEKTEDSSAKDEDRLILTTSDGGIENISPESSTSSPETLQNEESSEASAEPSQSNKDVDVVDTHKPEAEAEVDSSNEIESQEPKESEVSSSSLVMDTASSEADATPELPEAVPVAATEENIPAAVDTAPEPEESCAAEPLPQPDSEREPDTAMDVDSSSDKPEGSVEVSPE